MESEEQPDDGRTGNGAVDEVLAWVAGLDDLPLTEHQAVYERAHHRLQQALDAPGTVPGAPGGARAGDTPTSPEDD